MDESKDECENRSGDMINTLLILFLAIFLQELSTNSLNWYWTVAMLLAIIVLFLVKNVSFPLSSKKHPEVL